MTTGFNEWRNAAKPPSVLGIPCLAYFPILAWGAHPAWISFYFAVGSILLFGIMAKFGLTFTVLIAKLQHWARGPVIQSRPWWWRRRFLD